MLKSTVDYANMLFTCANEDRDLALELAVDASRAHAIVPASYFAEVIRHIISFAS